MLAIAVNALYTTLRKRGTTRQLAGAIVSSVICALLLLPALLWYNLRFSTEQAAISAVEVGLMLVYVALCGWVAPFGVTTVYCLFTVQRDSSTAGRLPRQRKSTTRNRTVAVGAQPQRWRQGSPASFVYSADKPWGWLVYRNGRFVGQELALKRAVISIGREEDNDVWLDDDTISRYHAELAWDKGQVYLTDNESLNGVLLNGRRIRSSVLLKLDDELEIGGHRFILKHAQPQTQDDLSDPLLPQVQRMVMNRNTPIPGEPFADHLGDYRPPAKPTVALNQSTERVTPSPLPLPPSTFALQNTADISGLETIDVHKSPTGEERAPGLCIIRSGELTGRSFLLSRPQISIGRGDECDVVLPDPSLARVHMQFFRHAEGDYIQDLASPTGSYVNGQLLQAPRLLRVGDRITLGNLHLEYTLLAEAKTTPMLPVSSLPAEAPISFPFSLRLPSRMRDEQ